MLTRSPVPTRSANSSPHSFHGSFHYAPGPSPRQSPSRISTALPQRQSKGGSAGLVTSSPRSPPARSRPYIAVDAATQYSPMESVIGRPRAETAAADSPEQVHREPPPPPHPIPLDGGGHDTSSTPGPSSPSEQSPGAIRRGVTVADVTNTISPGKRRNSQGPGAFSESAAGPSSQLASLPKRPRPAEEAPKELPTKYELCSVDDLVVLIANLLNELIETNDALGLKSGHLTRFHSRTAPGISVLDYLQRLAKHATLIQPLLLSMVYYIDRLCLMYPDFTINTLTVHRFLITAATVAAKGLSDSFWNNSTYARVGGVKVTELKLLELEFLYRVDWKIVPNPDLLVAYYKGLVDRCPGYTLAREENEDDSGGTTEGIAAPPKEHEAQEMGGVEVLGGDGSDRSSDLSSSSAESTGHG